MRMCLSQGYGQLVGAQDSLKFSVQHVLINAYAKAIAIQCFD